MGWAIYWKQQVSIAIRCAIESIKICYLEARRIRVNRMQFHFFIFYFGVKNYRDIVHELKKNLDVYFIHEENKIKSKKKITDQQSILILIDIIGLNFRRLLLWKNTMRISKRKMLSKRAMCEVLQFLHFLTYIFPSLTYICSTIRFEILKWVIMLQMINWKIPVSSSILPRFQTYF